MVRTPVTTNSNSISTSKCQPAIIDIAAIGIPNQAFKILLPKQSRPTCARPHFHPGVLLDHYYPR